MVFKSVLVLFLVTANCSLSNFFRKIRSSGSSSNICHLLQGFLDFPDELRYNQLEKALLSKKWTNKKDKRCCVELLTKTNLSYRNVAVVYLLLEKGLEIEISNELLEAKQVNELLIEVLLLNLVKNGPILPSLYAKLAETQNAALGELVRKLQHHPTSLKTVRGVSVYQNERTVFQFEASMFLWRSFHQMMHLTATFYDIMVQNGPMLHRFFAENHILVCEYFLQTNLKNNHAVILWKFYIAAISRHHKPFETDDEKDLVGAIFVRLSSFWDPKQKRSPRFILVDIQSVIYLWTLEADLEKFSIGPLTCTGRCKVERNAEMLQVSNEKGMSYTFRIIQSFLPIEGSDQTVTSAAIKEIRAVYIPTTESKPELGYSIEIEMPEEQLAPFYERITNQQQLQRLPWKTAPYRKVAHVDTVIRKCGFTNTEAQLFFEEFFPKYPEKECICAELSHVKHTQDFNWLQKQLNCLLLHLYPKCIRTHVHISFPVPTTTRLGLLINIFRLSNVIFWLAGSLLPEKNVELKYKSFPSQLSIQQIKKMAESGKISGEPIDRLGNNGGILKYHNVGFRFGIYQSNRIGFEFRTGIGAGVIDEICTHRPIIRRRNEYQEMDLKSRQHALDVWLCLIDSIRKLLIDPNLNSETIVRIMPYHRGAYPGYTLGSLEKILVEIDSNELLDKDLSAEILELVESGFAEVTALSAVVIDWFTVVNKLYALNGFSEVKFESWEHREKPWSIEDCRDFMRFKSQAICYF